MLLRVLISAFTLLLGCVSAARANLTSQVNRTGPYTVTSFPATLPVVFPFQVSSDITVLDLGQSGTSNDPALVLTLNSDYTVTGGGYNATTNMQSGNVVVITSGAHAVALNDQIVILRNVPVNQSVSFSTGILTAPLVEKGFDKQATLSQQLTETVSRGLRFEPGEILDGTLSRTARAGKLLGFDASGAISFSTGGGGSGSTYTAGTGLLLSSNQFSVNPTQVLTALTVTNAINGAITGNANSATQLINARTINGVAFDGTSNITITAAAGTLTGSSLAGTITSAPGLTTLAGGTVGSMAYQNSGSVSISGGLIAGTAVQGLPAPVSANDAVRLTDLNAISGGLVVRSSVLVATTANITLSGPQTIDGQSVVAGNRVLVKNQSTSSQNGIYDVAAGAWTRSTDSNTAAQLKVGYYYFVSSGTSQGSTGWTISTAPTTLGTDPVVFTQFGASTTYSAGTGLNLIGSVFSNTGVVSLAGTANEITASSSTGAITVSLPAALNFSGKTVSSGTFNSGTFNGSLGSTTPSTIAGTTETLNGQLTSTVATGTAPFVVSSTTQVANLNVATAGAATNATNATNTGVTDDTTTNATYYPTWVTSNTGNLPQKVSSTKFNFNPSTGIVTATGFNGAHNGSLGATSPSTAVVTTIASNSNANIRTSKGNFNIILNVKDYGALGDGSTNDTAAIASAFAAAGVNSSVYFPKGIYLTDQISLTAGTAHTFLSIMGDGAGTSVIKHRTANDTSGVISLGTDTTDVTINGLTFDGNCTARQSGAHAVILYGSRVRFYNNEIKNSGQFSVYTGGGTPSDILINNNYVHNSYADGINLSGCNNSECVGNIVDLVADDCFVAYGTSSFNITCTGNLFRGWSALASTVGRGILISSGAYNILCANNKIESIQQNGLFINNEGGGRCHDISIKNNQFSNCNIFSASVCTIQSADRITIEGNDISSTNQGDCVNFADVTDFVVKGGTLYNTLSNFRGIHADESSGWSGTTWTRINFKDITFNCTGASFCEAIYLNPNAGVTMTYLTIDSNIEMQQVTTGDYITIGGSSVTGHKICNNISSHGFTIHDFSGAATIVNNN
jgi:hypothetical protein